VRRDALDRDDRVSAEIAGASEVIVVVVVVVVVVAFFLPINRIPGAAELRASPSPPSPSHTYAY